MLQPCALSFTLLLCTLAHPFPYAFVSAQRCTPPGADGVLSQALHPPPDPGPLCYWPAHALHRPTPPVLSTSPTSVRCSPTTPWTFKRYLQATGQASSGTERVSLCSDFSDSWHSLKDVPLSEQGVSVGYTTRVPRQPQLVFKVVVETSSCRGIRVCNVRSSLLLCCCARTLILPTGHVVTNYHVIRCVL